MTVLSTAMRVNSLLLQTCGSRLVAQQEFFLKYVLDSLNAQIPSAAVLFYSQDPARIQHITKRFEKILISYGCKWLATDTANPPEDDALKTQMLFETPTAKNSVTQSLSTDSLSIELREIMVETFYMLARDGLFFPRTFIQYDCDIESCDLFDRSLLMLSRGILMPTLIQESQMKSWADDKDRDGYAERQYEDNYPRTGLGELFGTSAYKGLSSSCLDLMVLLLGHQLERVLQHGFEIKRPSFGSSNSPLTDEALKQILDRKHKKRLLIKATELFNNDKIKDSLNFLKVNGIIPEEPQPVDIARYLHQAPRINKKLLGEYLSKPKNFDILKCYVDMFVWADRLRIDEALRVMLEKFRLPGEAQQIQRVVEAFAGGFFERVVTKDLVGYEKKKALLPPPDPNTKPEAPPKNPDAVFVLAYSIIMYVHRSI